MANTTVRSMFRRKTGNGWTVTTRFDNSDEDFNVTTGLANAGLAIDQAKADAQAAAQSVSGSILTAQITTTIQLP